MNRILGLLSGVSPRAWLIGGLVAAAIAVTVIAISSIDHAGERAVETATVAGGTAAVAAGHEQTLDQLEKANAAELEVRLDRDGAKYHECLRDAAPGYAASCERYAPAQ